MAHFDGPYQKLRMELMKDAKEQNQQVIDGAKSDLKKLLQRFESELGDQPLSHRRFFVGRCRSCCRASPAWKASAFYPIHRCLASASIWNE